MAIKILYDNKLSVCVIDDVLNTKTFLPIMWDVGQSKHYFTYNLINYYMDVNPTLGDICWCPLV